MKFNIQILWPVFGVCLIAGLAYVGYQAQQKSEKQLIENVVFEGCVSKGADIEMRRVCGRFSKAYANGKEDYTAWGKVLTWDEEARIYVVKGDAK